MDFSCSIDAITEISSIRTAIRLAKATNTVMLNLVNIFFSLGTKSADDGRLDQKALNAMFHS